MEGKKTHTLYTMRDDGLHLQASVSSTQPLHLSQAALLHPSSDPGEAKRDGVCVGEPR